MREVSLRYANALYDLSSCSGKQSLILSELKALENLFVKDKEVQEFFASPLIKDVEKENVLKKSVKDKGLSEDVSNFVLILAQKGRMSIFSEVILSFQERSDKANGIVRGEVMSANPLSQEEKQEIQNVISGVIKKKVILTYIEDPNLIGGLVATVGSYTFNDTLTSHLTRLNDDLKRRTH